MSGPGDGHGGFRAGSGRPSSAASSSKKSPPPSRLSYQCPVCGSSKRSDKLKSHMIQLCHFDSDGKPMSIHDPRFKTLTREGREHTDYCRSKNITKDTLENSWKRLSPSSAEIHHDNPFLASKRKKPTEAICKVR